MQIQPGAVFLIYDEIAEKEKFIVILGVKEDKICVGTLFINSDINANVIRTLEQKHLQFRIKAKDYNFLHHDSWINASKIIRRDYKDLIKIFEVKKGEYKGELNSKDFDYLRSLMANSPMISKAEKIEFGLI